MKKTGSHSCRIHLEICQDPSHLNRVDDIGFTRLSVLFAMGFPRILVSLFHQSYMLIIQIFSCFIYNLFRG